jgi:ABC-type transport system involved in multi-copper enzyme maturation permease subunit
VDVPRFHLFEESLEDSFNAASFDMLLLVVFNVLFFMLAYAVFLRYDIT